MRFSSCCGDVLGHQLRVAVGLLDLHHIDVRGTAQEVGDLRLQGLDAGAAAADNHAGLASEDVHGDHLRAALNVDPADAGRVELFLQHFAELVILNEVVREILFAGIPAGAPVEDHTDASAVGIYFLTHGKTSYRITSGPAPR